MIDLEDDEQILLEIGPHSYFLIWPIFWSLFLSLIILGYSLAKAGFSFWFFVAFLISAGIFWTYAILSYARFYQNRAFLTNKRLWVKRQIKPLKVEVKEVGLKDILEVGYVIAGLRATFFGFGNLVIKTPAGKVIIEKVARPEKIKKQILALRDHWLRQ